MFKTHKDGLRMEPTPERVYAICQYISKQDCTRAEVQNKFSMFADTAQVPTEAITGAIRAAEELGAITTKDGKLVLAISPKHLKSYINFRRFVADRVLKQKDTTFFKVTQWYMNVNEKVFEFDTWENKADAIVQDGVDGISENDFLGWRFWASFLGEGYLHDKLLIPNMKIRIQDVLAEKFKQAFSYEAEIPAKDFLTWISSQIPETLIDIDGVLTLGFSNGLRTLSELNLISLRAQMDAMRVKLYPIEGEIFNDFSQIMVKEVIENELG
jgi:hypothetical protein